MLHFRHRQLKSTRSGSAALSHAHAVSPDEIARPGTTVGTSIVLRRSLESALSSLAPIRVHWQAGCSGCVERVVRVRVWVDPHDDPGPA